MWILLVIITAANVFWALAMCPRHWELSHAPCHPLTKCKREVILFSFLFFFFNIFIGVWGRSFLSPRQRRKRRLGKEATCLRPSTARWSTACTAARQREDVWWLQETERASLVVQWLRICLPMQGTRVRALVWQDPTCRGATRPVSHNYWACASGACAQQQERPR